MALSADTPRVYEIGEDSVIPVAAAAQIYEGSAVGSNGGYARALVAGDEFLGFARENKLGGTADADVNITVATRGRIQLAITSAAVTDLGKAVYASADGTFTFTATSNSRIGAMVRFVSTGVVIVEFRTSSIQTLGGVAALTDNGGGSADGTVASQAAPVTLTDSSGEAGTADTVSDQTTIGAALTDNSTGSAGDTIAAGVGVSTLSFDVALTNTGAVDVVTACVPGYKFKILEWEFVTGVAGVGAGASRVWNLEIGTTDVGTTPSTLTLTEAGTSAVGERTAGTTVTGANTGTASDTVSIEIATGGTDFSAGSGTILIRIQNMDTADAVASLSAKINTLRTDNLAASVNAGVITQKVIELVTLAGVTQNNIKEETTKVNEIIAALP